MLALVSSSSASAIGRLVRLKKRHVLLDAVLEHVEVLRVEVGHVARRAVGDRDVERDDLDAGAERHLRLRRRLGRLRRRVAATAPGAAVAVTSAAAATAAASEQ